MTPDSSRLSSSPTRTGRRRCPPAGASSPKRGVGGGRPRLDEDEEDRPLRRPQVGAVRTGNRQGGGGGAATGAATGTAGRRRVADRSVRVDNETKGGGEGDKKAMPRERGAGAEYRSGQQKALDGDSQRTQQNRPQRQKAKRMDGERRKRTEQAAGLQMEPQNGVSGGGRQDESGTRTPSPCSTAEKAWATGCPRPEAAAVALKFAADCLM